MPRLPTSLINRARALHPLLPLLLRPCRDLPSARNELRWLREHAIANREATPTSPASIRTTWPQHLHQMCLERAREKPLQYILGSQPFGPLEILCRKGVLIPRTETENITTHLASLLLLIAPSSNPPSTLRILDLCTGTGCIPLLLHSLLSPQIPCLQLCGVDISPAATTLADANLSHNITNGRLPANAGKHISFAHGDVFAAQAEPWYQANWDILMSNPPYISPTSFHKTTSRSVRNYEPKSALVPSAANIIARGPRSHTDAGDMFYPRLLEIAERVGARVLLVEVADMAQAVRVVKMVVETEKCVWEGCEIWRDWPVAGEEGEGEVVEIHGKNFMVQGEGNGRAVLAWRGEDGGRMIGRTRSLPKAVYGLQKPLDNRTKDYGRQWPLE